MTISTKPEDINNPEVLLHYMESHPHSGENRAAAKLLRKLLSAAPLVAATDNSQIDAEHWAELYRLRDAVKGPTGHETWQAAAEYERKLRIENHDFKNFHQSLCIRFGYSHDHIDWRRDQVSLIEYIAGQVAPQAPDMSAQSTHSENVSIEAEKIDILSQAIVDIEDACRSDWASFESDNGSDDIRYPGFRSIWLSGRTFGVEEGISTPPTSKATDEITVREVWLTIGGNPEFPATKDYLFQAINAMNNELSELRLSTSKADTGEAKKYPDCWKLEAFDTGVCFRSDRFRHPDTARDVSIEWAKEWPNNQWVTMMITPLFKGEPESATPSTIKAEPTLSGMERAFSSETMTARDERQKD